MKEIVLLAPIEDLYQKAEEIIAEQGYSNVEVVHGNMSGGVQVAREVLAQGAEILITRGGTYRLIQSAFDVPIVEIKVDAYDIITSYARIIGRPGETIGVVGYQNVVNGFDLLQKFLPNPIVKVELKQESDIAKVIAAHKQAGIRTYIGDSNVLPIVRGLGCEGILIYSQKDSIHTAIQEARRISKLAKEEKRRAQQITTITDFVHDALIAINEEQRLTVFNRAAEQVFGIPRADALGREVSQVVPNTRLPEVLATGVPQIGAIQNIGEASIATNRVPIIVDGEVKGAVATFQDITEVQYIEQKIRRSLSDKGFVARYTFSDIVYASDVMRACIEAAREYARYDTPVHICGASGVGKELFCQGMHNESPRRGGPFVAINCAAIPPSLIESELFGFEEGSFTGARRKGKPGIFELAHNGTLFLDEISEIPMELQGRLLRVLQEKQVMRVGGSRIIPVDTRIITASNRYLKQQVHEGKFRKDLFYRINILTLRVPPLDSRREDIPVLAAHFIRKYSEQYGKNPPMELTVQARALLAARDYEGNVRELEGLIERCVILSSFDSLKGSGSRAPAAPAAVWQPQEAPLRLREMERAYILKIYEQTGQNIQKTCGILGINRSTLWRKLKEFQEDVEK